MIHKVYELSIRARLGTAAQFCEVVVLCLKGSTFSSSGLECRGWRLVFIYGLVSMAYGLGFQVPGFGFGGLSLEFRV